MLTILLPPSPPCVYFSACHGAVRAMSRSQATKLWQGKTLVDQLAAQGIIIRSPSMRGVAEEAPLAYKDVSARIGPDWRAKSPDWSR